jgi:hypothetical protein
MNSVEELVQLSARSYQQHLFNDGLGVDLQAHELLRASRDTPLPNELDSPEVPTVPLGEARQRASLGHVVVAARVMRFEDVDTQPIAMSAQHHEAWAIKS